MFANIIEMDRLKKYCNELQAEVNSLEEEIESLSELYSSTADKRRYYHEEHAKEVLKRIDVEEENLKLRKLLKNADCYSCGGEDICCEWCKEVREVLGEDYVDG